MRLKKRKKEGRKDWEVKEAKKEDKKVSRKEEKQGRKREEKEESTLRD